MVTFGQGLSIRLCTRMVRDGCECYAWQSQLADTLSCLGVDFADSHVTKSIRSLLLYSRLYGHLPPGGLLGTYKGNGKTDETIPGISKLGGDLFSRAVGLIFEQTGFLDTSALGYYEAWEGKDKDEK
jgi:hypothetical protein